MEGSTVAGADATLTEYVVPIVGPDRTISDGERSQAATSSAQQDTSNLVVTDGMAGSSGMILRHLRADSAGDGLHRSSSPGLALVALTVRCSPSAQVRAGGGRTASTGTIS